MRILLVRHGESEGNVNEKMYVQKGDQNVALTDKGWKQAIGAGGYLSGLYNEGNSWPVIYLSSYTRTKETLSGIFHTARDAIAAEPRVYEEPRLIEKHFGATNMLNDPIEGIDPGFAENLKALSNAIHSKDPFTTPNPLGESSKDNLLAVKNFIDGTLMRDAKHHDDFLLITHGATIKNFLLSWAHLPMVKRDEIPAIGNCDIISLEKKNGAWDIRKVYDGPSGKAVDIGFLDGIKPYSFDDLPPVPQHILDQLPK